MIKRSSEKELWGWIIQKMEDKKNRSKQWNKEIQRD